MSIVHCSPGDVGNGKTVFSQYSGHPAPESLLIRIDLMASVTVLLPVAYISLPPPIFYRILPSLGTCLGTR
jgi:hypothetical protein